MPNVNAMHETLTYIARGANQSDLTDEESLRCYETDSPGASRCDIDRVAARATDQLFDVGGASSASRKKNLDRHWRAIRALTLHNPTICNAQYVGRHLIHCEDFPTDAYF